MVQIANDTQLHRVLTALQGGQWQTLLGLGTITGDTTSSIASRIRDLRLPVYGGHDISARQVNGQWEYRLNQGAQAVAVAPGPAPIIQSNEPEIKFIDVTTLQAVLIPKSRCKVEVRGKVSLVIATDSQGVVLSHLATTESKL